MSHLKSCSSSNSVLFFMMKNANIGYKVRPIQWAGEKQPGRRWSVRCMRLRGALALLGFAYSRCFNERWCVVRVSRTAFAKSVLGNQ